jgi:hypothetical protein
MISKGFALEILFRTATVFREENDANDAKSSQFLAKLLTSQTEKK